MAALVSIISKSDLRIEVHHRSQPTTVVKLYHISKANTPVATVLLKLHSKTVYSQMIVIENE